MRFKNIAFAAAVLLIAATALSGCKGQGESGGNSSAFLKEESVVSSSEPQSTPEESGSEPQETSKTDGDHTHEYTETVTPPHLHGRRLHTSQMQLRKDLQGQYCCQKRAYLRRLGCYKTGYNRRRGAKTARMHRLRS